MVFARDRMEALARRLRGSRFTALTLTAAALMGAASPVTLHGAVPLLLALAAAGTPPGILIAFAVASILINPTILIYTLALGIELALVRTAGAAAAGVLVGGAVHLIQKSRPWTMPLLTPSESQTAPQPPGFSEFIRHLARGIKKTAPNLVLGFFLTALFILYLPAQLFTGLFSSGPAEGLGVLFAASLGGPLYFCGGGTVPLLRAWLHAGMSPGAAAAFMITGPATKVNNLTALRNLLPRPWFIPVLITILVVGVLYGMTVNLILRFL